MQIGKEKAGSRETVLNDVVCVELNHCYCEKQVEEGGPQRVLEVFESRQVRHPFLH
jgi:hypothetical protein